MAGVKRVKPAEAREKVTSGQALFVCSYESGDLCERNRLEGSIPVQELVKRLPSLPKTQEIIFYCA